MMKQIIAIILLFSIANIAFSQIEIRLHTEYVNNFDKDYSHKSISFGGEEVVMIGNVENLDNFLRNLVKIETQEKKVKSIHSRIGISTGIFTQPASFEIGVKTSKFNYFMPDFYFSSEVRPVYIYTFFRNAITGLSYEPAYMKFLKPITVGYKAGNDLGMPGFLNYREQKYQCATIGLDYLVGENQNILLNFDTSFQIRGNEDLNQSHMTAGLSFIF